MQIFSKFPSHPSFPPPALSHVRSCLRLLVCMRLVVPNQSRVLFFRVHPFQCTSKSESGWLRETKKKNSINGIQETWIILRDESLFHGFSAYFFSLQLSSPSSNLRLERNLRVWLFLSDLLWVLLAWLIVWTVISKNEAKVGNFKIQRIQFRIASVDWHPQMKMS